MILAFLIGIIVVIFILFPEWDQSSWIALALGAILGIVSLILETHED